MYQVENDSQAATTTDTAENLRPEQWTRVLLEIDLVGQLPPSNGYTYLLTAFDVFSTYMFAIFLRRPNAQLVVNGLISIFTGHEYVPKTSLRDKSTAFTVEVVKRTMEQAGISFKHVTRKIAETISMLEVTDQKLDNFLKINISAHQQQWDHYLNKAVIAHNTTFHASLKGAPTKNFHGRTLQSALDLKFGKSIHVTTQPTNLEDAR